MSFDTINNLRFCTYNIGDYEKDNIAAHAEFGSPRSPLSAALARAKDHEKEQIKKGFYDHQETLVAQKIAERADVICLQQIGAPDRAFLAALKMSGFSVYPQANGTAVAVRNHLHSKSSGLQFTINRIRIAVASLHIRENINDCNNKIITKIKEYISSLRNTKADLILGAGDMNNATQNFLPPLECLRQNKFMVLEPQQPTKFHVSGDIVTDLFFLGSARMGRIKTINAPPDTPRVISRFEWLCGIIDYIFFDRIEIIVTPPVVPGEFSYRLDWNCSNHQPVFLTLTVVKHLSLFHECFG